MALHQRLVVEVRYTSIFDIATHIKNLIGGDVVSEILENVGWNKQHKGLPCTSQGDLAGGTQRGSGS